ncbi:MAG: hypothetical protein KBC98_01475 [Candidatus Pacebacteria bacterium]|nr:hypothetical protein [Candidatus Paceibacterota bacterium]
MKKIIVLTIPISEVQQILRDGNYLKTDEIIDSVSIENNEITFNCSLNAEKEADGKEGLLNTALVDTDLSVRALNGLKLAGIATLGELVNHSGKYLLRFRKIGPVTLKELGNFLESKGLQFKKDEE